MFLRGWTIVDSCKSRYQRASVPHVYPLRGTVHGNSKLPVPVKFAAAVAHLKIGGPGLLECYHVSDMRGNPRFDNTFIDLFRSW